MPPGPAPDVSADWWRRFFDADWQRLYGHATTEDDTAHDVNDLVQLIGLEPGMTVLDVPCGFGRLAIPLAMLGCVVHGIDGSTALIEQARQAATVARVEVTFAVADMRGPLPAMPFDVVLNMDNAFGYFADRRDDLRQLDAMTAAVATGGRLVLEVANRASHVALPQTEDLDLDGHRVLVERWWDATDEVLTTRFRGEALAEPVLHRQRLYTPEALVTLLEERGHEVLLVGGGLDGGPVSGEDDVTVLVSTPR